MKFKKLICTFAALAAVLGTSALAKDNIYAYNKFISTILGPQEGYCDLSASFAGHEDEYENVNDFFAGLISAFYDDLDADYDNELVTVDSHGITFYEAGENGVVYLAPVSRDLIANYGDSFANVFTVPNGKKIFVGLETYGKTVNDYFLNLYEVNADTDDVTKVVEINREDNEDGIEEKVWAGGKTFYSYTKGGGLETSINPDNYADFSTAGAAAIARVVPEMKLDADELKKRMTGSIDGDDFRFYVKGTTLVTYVRATGIRFSQTPVVYFEDISRLSELCIAPDIVKVVLDGHELQFPTQDPMIIDNRTLVPMRTIFEALGADVQWKDENGVQSILATTDTTIIEMTIGKNELYVNGEKKELDVPPQLINDKTLVPVRAVSESLGCYVGWDQDAKTVIIQSHI